MRPATGTTRHPSSGRKLFEETSQNRGCCRGSGQAWTWLREILTRRGLAAIWPGGRKGGASDHVPAPNRTANPDRWSSPHSAAPRHTDCERSRAPLRARSARLPFPETPTKNPPRWRRHLIWRRDHLREKSQNLEQPPLELRQHKKQSEEIGWRRRCASIDEGSALIRGGWKARRQCRSCLSD